MFQQKKSVSSNILGRGLFQHFQEDHKYTNKGGLLSIQKVNFLAGG